MSQNQEKYLYFNVGMLKNSFALDALWQDALKYHMIDQPGKLIALRLTEYYEMAARGTLHPDAGLDNGDSRERMAAGSNGASYPTNQRGDGHSEDESIIAASPDAEQNADEAAEYWASL